MPRYILVDHNSGYVWGDTAELDGPARDETPEQAARRLDEAIGGRRADEYAYTLHRRGRPEGNGYLVYQADAAFPLIDDGQDQGLIDQVERECSYLGFVAVQGGGGPMTGTDLEAFRAMMQWSRAKLGAELDVSQKRLRRLLDGVQPIPQHIALACAALAYGLPPLSGTPGHFSELRLSAS